MLPSLTFKFDIKEKYLLNYFDCFSKEDSHFEYKISFHLVKNQNLDSHTIRK